MQILRESDYAIRSILHLARQPQRLVSATETADAIMVDKMFLAKILQQLAKAGLVQSQRGLRGGFKLARDPGEITLLDVVEAIQGPIALNRCAVTGTYCALADVCPAHPVWVKLTAQVARELAKHTFKKLVQQDKKSGRTRKSGKMRLHPAAPQGRESAL